ncbi:hypothetical protein BDZ97DRAFT_463161 [Flammula alnicola]|nr:hypothetical protein BDZ97DRAFT_463161 [Flammula alnicola]
MSDQKRELPGVIHMGRNMTRLLLISINASRTGSINWGPSPTTSRMKSKDSWVVKIRCGHSYSAVTMISSSIKLDSAHDMQHYLSDFEYVAPRRLTSSCMKIWQLSAASAYNMFMTMFVPRSLTGAYALVLFIIHAIIRGLRGHYSLGRHSAAARLLIRYTAPIWMQG